MKSLRRFEPHTYALMRIVIGFLFLAHGTQKLLSFPIEHPGAPAWVLFVAGPIELIGGTFVMVGLLTRPAAFLCSGLMAAGDWLAHGYKAFFPIANGGEAAAFYCFVFLFIAARGAGIWSVDGRSENARDRTM